MGLMCVWFEAKNFRSRGTSEAVLARIEQAFAQIPGIKVNALGFTFLDELKGLLIHTFAAVTRYPHLSIYLPLTEKDSRQEWRIVFDVIFL